MCCCGCSASQVFYACQNYWSHPSSIKAFIFAEYSWLWDQYLRISYPHTNMRWVKLTNMFTESTMAVNSLTNSWDFCPVSEGSPSCKTGSGHLPFHLHLGCSGTGQVVPSEATAWTSETSPRWTSSSQPVNTHAHTHRVSFVHGF